MNNVEILLDDFAVEVEGDYRKSEKDQFDKKLGAWSPGDPEMVENLKVFVLGNDKRIEITEALSTVEMEEIEERFCEFCREDL